MDDSLIVEAVLGFVGPALSPLYLPSVKIVQVLDILSDVWKTPPARVFL
jgi:hypothetical protein